MKLPKIGLTALLALVMLLAVGAPVAYAEDGSWQAAYWDNADLSGDPVLYRAENSINYNWGIGSPNTSVPDDNFSARWVRYYTVTAGSYRFTATSDDGMRVRLNGETIINDWDAHAERTVTVDRTLSAGTYYIEVEYRELSYSAIAKFTFTAISDDASISDAAADDAGGTGSTGSSPTGVWYGEYYVGTNLEGWPIYVAEVSSINFDWGGGSPDVATLGTDYFSIRWKQTVNFPAGSYTFRVTVDDGVRLYIDGVMVIDEWAAREPAVFEVTRTVNGDTEIILEYFEATANARVKLEWGKAGTLGLPEFTPGGGEVGGGGISTDPGSVAANAIVVDNDNVGFNYGGWDADWIFPNGGYGGNFRASLNVYGEGNYNWARWYPRISQGFGAGYYEVLAFVPEVPSLMTTNARYWVRHSGGYTRVNIDQSEVAGQWVSLGTYYFRGDGYDRVSLSDVTYEYARTRTVVYDAIQFVPQD